MLDTIIGILLMNLNKFLNKIKKKQHKTHLCLIFSVHITRFNPWMPVIMHKKGLIVCSFFFHNGKDKGCLRASEMLISKNIIPKVTEQLPKNFLMLSRIFTVTLPGYGAKKKFNERSLRRLVQTVGKTPHKTFKELQVDLEKSRVMVSASTICCTLNQVGLHGRRQRSKPKRQD